MDAVGQQLNTPDCKSLLSRFVSRNRHFGRPTYNPFEELRINRYFYRGHVTVGERSFTSRSFHPRKKDAEQDAAYEAMKVLCPQMLGERKISSLDFLDFLDFLLLCM